MVRPAAWPLTRIATAVGALGLALGIAAGATALVDTSGSDPSPAGTPTTIAPPTPAAPPLGTTAGTTTADTRPLVPAAAYAVFDVGSDCWMASVHGEETRPVGSLMKLLTARVVMDAGEPERVVTVPELHLSADESVIGLAPGETQRRDVLLRAMLIVSANDAATALAVDVAGSESAFVDLMNATADDLGLDATVAANPTGLDATGSGSSAHDLVVLADLLMGDESFRATVARTEAHLHGQTFPSTNQLLTTYQGATGIKTGTTTAAGPSVIASATRGDRSVIVAVLGATSPDARFADAATLLDWAFAHEPSC